MKQRADTPLAPFGNLATDLPLAYHHVQKLPEIFPDEAHLLLPYDDKRSIERSIRVKRISSFLEKGEDTLALDLGCMAGQTTTPLQFATQGKVIGMDRNQDSVRLAKARNADNPSVDYLEADFLGWDIPRGMEGRADQIFASYFLHEIYSVYGRSGYYEALSKCRAILGEGGRLIILDGVHPEPLSAQVSFRDGQTREQFERFVDLYRPFRVAYESVNDGTIEVDLGDFARFLNSLKFIVPTDLKSYEATLRGIAHEHEGTARAFFILDYYTCPLESYAPEYAQDFTFNSRAQWLDTLDAAGFDVEYLTSFNERRIEACFWSSGIEILSPEGKLPEIHICIVGRKR
jgi:SAM-dependent methyltransferase